MNIIWVCLQVKEERIGGVERTRMSLKRESWSSKRMVRVSKPPTSVVNNASWVSEQPYWHSFNNLFLIKKKTINKMTLLCAGCVLWIAPCGAAFWLEPGVWSFLFQQWLKKGFCLNQSTPAHAYVVMMIIFSYHEESKVK